VRLFTFDNSIRVPTRWLSREQRKRYKSNSLGILHEPEEEGVFLDALNSLPAGGAYVNIGAAWGYYSLLAKKTRPELDVFAVEAHPRMCSMIYEASMINHISGISVINSAVVGKNEIERREMRIKFGYGASVTPEDSVNKNESIRVGLIDLGVILGSIPNPEIMISMDVQGSEEGVCRDLATQPEMGARVSKIIVGTHGTERHDICKEMLEKSGFSIDFDEPAPLEQPDGFILATKK